MRQHNFCPDKQQYNNAKHLTVYVVVIEEVENFSNVSNIIHKPKIST